MTRRQLLHDRAVANGLAWAALALAVLPSTALLVLPTYSTSSSTDSPSGQIDTTSSATLLQHEGTAVLLLFAIPVGLCLLGLNWPGRAQSSIRHRRQVAGVVLLLASIGGAASFGLFYFPAAGLLIGAALLTPPCNNAEQLTPLQHL